MRFPRRSSQNNAGRPASRRPVDSRRSLRCEHLEARVLLDATGIGDSSPLPPLEPGLIYGRVWQDANANRRLDAGELGMGGVTVYSDINFNGRQDAAEPSTATIFDNPLTSIDESGFYVLDQLQPGYHNVRQVVPAGYEQTFPSLPPGFLPPPWGDPSVHVVFVDSGAAVDDVDFGNHAVPQGSLAGSKWEDLNGNAERDANERGLGGVTVYLDANDNGIFEANEPYTVTSHDDPWTDFDEAGRYRFDGLFAGDYVVREVVPGGYEQTFPLAVHPAAQPDGASEGADPSEPFDEFATVSPEQIDVAVAPGDVLIVDAAITIHPSIFVPIEIDVFALPPTHLVLNLSGPQLNGGTGDTTTFELMILGDDTEYEGRLEFIDLANGNAIASIPLLINVEAPPDGAHRVWLEPGQHLENLDFGNRPLGSAAVEGRKWLDANGNGLREASEPGLEGVTIYADLNRNGVLDGDEPSVVTSADDPSTDFDEGGFYQLELPSGEHWIAEVVPHGFMQTFPNHPVPAIFPPPPGAKVHFVFLTPGEVLSGIDFGNRPIDTGFANGRIWQDFNANAERDPQEPGQGGVTVYADYNFNGTHDAGEPATESMHDIPETDFDEGGLYILEARAGFTAIRQIVPPNHVQTFPTSDATSPLEQGAHFVNIEPGVETPHLDFGNFPLDVPPRPLPGDLNGDGLVDRQDLDYWEASYGAPSIALDATPGHNEMNGRSFLDWQRNVGPASEAAPARVASGVLPAVNLDGSPVAASRADDARRPRRAKDLARDVAFSEAALTALPSRQPIDARESHAVDAAPVRGVRYEAARRAAFAELDRSIDTQLP